jgi:hypothetical protein
MDTLIVKCSTYTFSLIGSRADLMEIVALISSTSVGLELAFESALKMLYIETGKFQFDLNVIKGRLFQEIQYFHKRLDIRVEAHDNWAEQRFDSIDFNQDVEDWFNSIKQ